MKETKEKELKATNVLFTTWDSYYSSYKNCNNIEILELLLNAKVNLSTDNQKYIYEFRIADLENIIKDLRENVKGKTR